MVCDGGGWLRSNKQRTSFLLVVQDEIVKTPPKKKNVKAIEDDPAKKNKKLMRNNSITSIRKALKPIGNHKSRGNDSVVTEVSSRALIVKPVPKSIRKVSPKVSSNATPLIVE